MCLPIASFLGCRSVRMTHKPQQAPQNQNKAYSLASYRKAIPLFLAALLAACLCECSALSAFKHHQLGLTPCAKTVCVRVKSLLQALVQSPQISNLTFDDYRLKIVLSGSYLNSTEAVRLVKVYCDSNDTTALVHTASVVFVDSELSNVRYFDFSLPRALNFSVVCISVARVEAKIEVANVSITATITASWTYFEIGPHCPSWVSMWSSNDPAYVNIVKYNNVTFPLYDRCFTQSLTDTAPMSAEVSRSLSSAPTPSNPLLVTATQAALRSLTTSASEQRSRSQSVSRSRSQSVSLEHPHLDADLRLDSAGGERHLYAVQSANSRHDISLTISNECRCSFCRYRCATSDGIRTTPVCPTVGICIRNVSSIGTKFAKTPLCKLKKVLLAVAAGSPVRMSDSASCSMSISRSASAAAVSASDTKTETAGETATPVKQSHTTSYALSMTISTSKEQNITQSILPSHLSISSQESLSVSNSKKSPTHTLASLSFRKSLSETEMPTMTLKRQSISTSVTISDRLSMSQSSSNSGNRSTPTASASCRIDMLSFVRNSSIVLPAFTPNGSSIDMAILLASRYAVVTFEFYTTIHIENLAGFTTSFGEVSDYSWPRSPGDPNEIRLTLSTEHVDLHQLTLISPQLWYVSITPRLDGYCLPFGFEATFTSAFTLLPLKTSSGLAQASSTASRISSIASAVTLNPVTSMTATAMISMLSLSQCAFSDVDPLEPSASPVGWAVGDTLGQYYRGAAVVGLTVYVLPSAIIPIIAAVRTALSAADPSRDVLLDDPVPFAAFLASFRFPSFALVLVSVFHQGLMTVGVALCRGAWSSVDLALGIASIVACVAATAVCMLQSTRNFRCEVEPVVSEGVVENAAVNLVLKTCSWDLHWRETREHFKRCHLSMLNGLRCPWWSAVELASGALHGVVLGIRINSQPTCQAQLFLLAVFSFGMLIFCAFVRPCGAFTDNANLLLSKLASFVMALLLGLASLFPSLSLADGVEIVSSAASAASVAATICQIVVVVILSRAQIINFFVGLMRPQSTTGNLLLDSQTLSVQFQSGEQLFLPPNVEHVADASTEMASLASTLSDPFGLPLIANGSSSTSTTQSEEDMDDEAYAKWVEAREKLLRAIRLDRSRYENRN